MSHNIEETKAPTHTRTIAKSRVIVGLLGEVDASDAVVLLTSEHHVTLNTGLACEFKVPFESSTLTLRGPLAPPGIYHASVLFAGQRLNFRLQVLDDTGLCRLPQEIHITDLRQQKRRRFGPEIEIAEISTKHGVVMAVPVDMSQNSISLIMNSKEAHLRPGERVRLTIRGDTTGRDIFSAELLVQDFKSGAKQARILLTPKTPQEHLLGYQRRRRTVRHETTHVSFVLNISLTGFQCQIADATQLSWMTPGMSMKLKDHDLTATIVWKEGHHLGARLDALDDSQTLQLWVETLKAYKIGHGFHHGQVEDLVNLFTESGLLKGSRRRIYGNEPGGFLPPDKMLSNPLLYHRIVAVESNGRNIGHMSAARLTDEMFYFQEGTHVGGSGPSFKNIYGSIIQLSRTLYNSSRQSPRYLSGLYHENIKSAGAFGVELFADPSSRVFPMFQSSISKNLSSFTTPSPTKIISINDFDADQRRLALQNFDATLVEAFSGWNGEHPRLNSELSKLGTHHEAKTLLLANDQGVWGMAYRLRSYYALNATGVMNSLFLVVKKSTSSQDILSGIHALVDQGLAFGTDDAAIIVDTKLDESIDFLSGIADPKPFTFFLIDNHLNKEFLGASTEPQDAVGLRKNKV
jgi:hypothetical protein